MFELFRRRSASQESLRSGDSTPPAPTKVSVLRFAGLAGGADTPDGGRGPGAGLRLSSVEPGDGVAEGDLAATLVLVLTGRFAGPPDLAAGDVLLPGDSPGRLVCAGPDPGVLLLQRLDGAGRGRAGERIGRDELRGEPFPGVSGARLLFRAAGRSVLRLGPPPGARWVVRGLGCFAVFRGKVEVVEGDATVPVHSGEVAFAEEAEAPLYLQAGSDSAVAIGIGGPQVGVGLG